MHAIGIINIAQEGICKVSREMHVIVILFLGLCYLHFRPELFDLGLVIAQTILRSIIGIAISA